MSTGGNQGGDSGEWIPPDEHNVGGPGSPPPPPPGSSPWGSAGQPQWQPPYGGHSGGGEPVPNHLVWSILSTVLCCMPFGIVSIVFSTQVNTKQAQGDYTGAVAASKKAKTWAIASAVAGVVAFVLLVGLGFLGAFLPASQNASF